MGGHVLGEMRRQHSTASKVGTLFWSLTLGLGFVALGTSILMPATKSARIVKPEDEATYRPPTTQEVEAARTRHLMPGSKSMVLMRPEPATRPAQAQK